MVEIVAHVACWTCLFGQTPTMWSSYPQYRQRLFTHRHYFIFFVSGLNYVLSICMGLSLGANTICLRCNKGGANCFNVGDGSQHLSCQCSKSWLSQHTTCMIAWFKVVGWNMVNKRSYKSPWNPNSNWLKNVASSHEMSHASCLNS